MGNKSLSTAKSTKNDEFYTCFDDIQNELNHYREHFKGKVVYCNCDDPAESAFADFFKLNFDHYGLKKLICTRYAKSDLFLQFDSVRRRIGYKLEITSKDKCEKIDLSGGGDFRSRECIELLKESDIVCTNPPFSLFREYIHQLMEYDKKFLVIGNKNAVSTKEIFPLIQNNKMWLGYTTPKDFLTPEGKPSGKMGGLTRWFTNLDIEKRHEDIVLYEKYTPEKYPNYDNFEGIEVSRVTEIPKDYSGIMGVPVTFLDKYNPEQFEILGITKTWFGAATKIYPKQIQVSQNGNKKMVSKLNDGAVLEKRFSKKPSTYYEVDGGEYVQVFPRILVKRKD